MTLCELTMFPTDKGVSVSAYVSRVLDIIDKSGLTYRLTPMSTIIEGEWDDVIKTVTTCFRELERDCDRISVSLKVDFRKGTASRMGSKIDAIERHLGRRIST